MKKIRIIFLCFLFGLTSSLVHAKVNVNGFVILNNGDTLKGEITILHDRLNPDILRITNLFSEVTFLQDNKKGTTYFPKDLKGFGVEIDSVYLYFVSKKASKRLLPNGEKEGFLRVVEKGYLNLYEFQSPTESNFFNVRMPSFYSDYLIQKESGEIFILYRDDVRENTIRDLEKFFGDETELFQRMKDGGKLYIRIPQYTKEYNQIKRVKNNTN